MSDRDFTIEERDQAGQLIATYSTSSRAEAGAGPCIKAHKAQSGRQSSVQALIDAFLPTGYPHTVTPDYLSYQIYDSVQAFVSSLASLLASRSVLEATGVGSTTTTPTHALLLSITTEIFGRLSTIAFAARFSASLTPECKMYRFLADILSDAAMILDCLSPLLHGPWRLLALTTATVGRALCGIAAGSAKAELSAHFAKCEGGNLGEVSAKDASQETVISLLGMLAGSVVIGYVRTTGQTWALLLMLLGVHLGANHRAVRAVEMDTLNRQRAGILFGTFLRSLDLSKGKIQDSASPATPAAATTKVLTPHDVAKLERIFEHSGVYRATGKEITAHCQIGAPFSKILYHLAKTGTDLTALLSIFEHEHYILSELSPAHYAIVLKRGASAETQLLAWLHFCILSELRRVSAADAHTSGSSAFAASESKQALLASDSQTALLAEMTPKSSASRTPPITNLTLINQSLDTTRSIWRALKPRLEHAGWDIQNVALETGAGSRVCVVDGADEGKGRKEL